MLAKYDVPIPQVRLKIKVVEVTTENDDKMGIDFQSWKNNEGADFFSVGGRMRNNWAALYTGGNMPDRGYGSERTSFYNFNPKWNTRYLDFLVSKGKAKVAYTGEMLIRNNTPALLDRSTQIFYIDVSKPVPDATELRIRESDLMNCCPRSSTKRLPEMTFLSAKAISRSRPSLPDSVSGCKSPMPP